MAKSSASFTPETAPRVGGKPGRQRKTTLMRTNAELLAASKLMTPLEVLQGFANDEQTDEGLRITAANAAARYVHKPMPQSIEHSGTVRMRHTFAAAVLGEDDEGTPS